MAPGPTPCFPPAPLHQCSSTPLAHLVPLLPLHWCFVYRSLFPPVLQGIHPGSRPLRPWGRLGLQGGHQVPTGPWRTPLTGKPQCCGPGMPLTLPLLDSYAHMCLPFPCCCLVAQSWPILWHRRLQHTRFPCSSPSPRVCSHSCPLSQWCHPTSVVLFYSCLQSFLASGSFPMSLLFSSGGQSIGSFSFNANPSNEYSGLIFFRIDWFDHLAVQGIPKSLLQYYSWKASILWFSAIFIVQLSHPYMTTGKNHSFD